MTLKISLFAFLLFSLLLTGCGAGGADAQSATPTPFPTPVRSTYTVQRGDMVLEAKLFGVVAPLALNTAYFQMDGQISKVFATVGDKVTAGQLLAELSQLKQLQAKAGETRRTIRRAEIALELAKLQLEKIKQGGSALDIQIQTLVVELAQMDRNEVYEKLGLDPALTEDALAELDAEVAKARLYSPADGIIVAAAKPGQNVALITAAFVLGDPAKLEVTAKFENNADTYFKQVFEGMPVTLRVSSRPEVVLTGTIRQLPSPYGTGTEPQVVDIVIDQPPSEQTYQAGDKVSVVVQLASKAGILWLPPQAIRQVSGRTFVIVDSESGPRRIDVEIGLKSRDMVEIISGLDEGQVVIGQ